MIGAFLTLAYWPAFPASSSAQSALEEVETELAQRTVADARPSVVTIEWEMRARKQPISVVSGTLVNAQGHILTAGLPAHAGKGQFQVTDYRQRTWNARWIGFDRYTGLTLLSVSTGNLPAAPMAQQMPRIGEPVWVIGGTRRATSARRGTLRKIRRPVQIEGQLLRHMLEFSAPLTNGDAGAMLANAQGEMIGIVRGRLAPEGPATARHRNGGANGDSVGVAVPAGVVGRVAEQLARGGNVQRGYLGVVVEEVRTAKGSEIRVIEITAGAPADSAGLRIGDVIRHAQERPITTVDDLSGIMLETGPGEPLSLQVGRGVASHTVQVILGRIPTRRVAPLPLLPPELLIHHRRPLLGLRAQDMDAGLRDQLKLSPERGALVVEVLRDGPAASAGLRPFDVIVAVDQDNVQSAADLDAVVRKAGAGKTVNLRWMRDHRHHEGPLTLGGKDDRLRRDENREPDAPQQQRIRSLQRRIRELEQKLRELREQRPRAVPTDDPSEHQDSALP